MVIEYCFEERKIIVVNNIKCFGVFFFIINDYLNVLKVNLNKIF